MLKKLLTAVMIFLLGIGLSEAAVDRTGTFTVPALGVVGTAYIDQNASTNTLTVVATQGALMGVTKVWTSGTTHTLTWDDNTTGLLTLSSANDQLVSTATLTANGGRVTGYIVFDAIVTPEATTSYVSYADKGIYRELEMIVKAGDFGTSYTIPDLSGMSQMLFVPGLNDDASTLTINMLLVLDNTYPLYNKTEMPVDSATLVTTDTIKLGGDTTVYIYGASIGSKHTLLIWE